MAIDIDNALAQLSARSPYEGLAGLEERVLNAVATPGEGGTGGASVFAIGLALTLGLALGLTSNLVPPDNPARAPSLAALGTPDVLAPSSLLLDAR